MSEETKRRIAARVEIPGLSSDAQAFLARYRAAKRTDQPSLVARALATPGGRAVLGEFTAVKTAGGLRVQAYKIDEDRAAGSITHMFARVPELTPAQGAAIGELVVVSRGIERHRFELEYTQERTLRRGLDREGPSLGR